MESLVDSIKLVMDDLLKRDSLDQREKPRKMFIAGASLGAFIWCAPSSRLAFVASPTSDTALPLALCSLKYIINYPSVNKENHNVDGVFLMCPLITISPETR